MVVRGDLVAVCVGRLAGACAVCFVWLMIGGWLDLVLCWCSFGLAFV